MSRQKIAYRIRVEGRVQRTGYRRFVLENAQETGIKGYVKNEKDGSVTIFAQGEEDKLNNFIDLIKAPPSPISIKSFVKEDAKINPKMNYFEIKFGSIAEELQEGFGAMEKEFRDYRQEFKEHREEFRNYREEFRDFRQEFKDYREEFRDFRQEFKDYREEFRDFRQEFKDYREEFRSFADRTDKNFKILEEKYGEISSKLTQILETLQEESIKTREELTRAVDTLSDLVRQFISKSSDPCSL